MARNANIISVTSGTKRPDFTKLIRSNKKFKNLWDRAMYYAHYELPQKRLKTESIKYAKSAKIKNYETLEILDNWDFGVLGKPCYILNNKGEIPEEWETFVSSKFTELLALAEQRHTEKLNAKEEKEVVPVITVQDRLKAQASEVSADMDGWFDEFITDPKNFKADKYSPLTYMRLANLKAGHVRYIQRFYEDGANEVKCALDGSDEQLNEAYSVYTKPQIKKLQKLYESISDACTIIIESSKAERKPRKRAEQDIAKVVEKLKYLKNDADNGIVSINPIDIVGAQELWVYNTRTRKIGRYIATDGDGLGVKNATILNFSEASVEKTLRKPKAQLKEFKSLGKVAVRKYMDSIATIDTKLKSRLNDNHVLLKVVK